MSKRFNSFDFLSLVGLFALVGVSNLIFDYGLNINYFEWYLEYGAKISWGTALFALFWGDLNESPLFISSHPSEYIGGYAMLLSDLFLMQAVITVAKQKSDPPIISNYTLDSMLALLLNILLTLLVLTWVIVIAPIQYFVFIVCGAPVRQIICSQQNVEGKKIKWFTGDLSQKPFSVTAAYTGMVLWILNLIY